MQTPSEAFTAHAAFVAKAGRLMGGTVVQEWTFKDGRAAFLRGMRGEVAGLAPIEKLDHLIRRLYLVIAMTEDERVRLWACWLQDELQELRDRSAAA
jgi:hypothetical protein